MGSKLGITTKLQEEFDFDIVDEFISHYGIMSESMEPTIISLSHKENYSIGINNLFRVAHNIKSATGFLKVDVINVFFMTVEDVLEKARILEGPASEEFIDWLLLVSDQMNLWLKNFNNDENLALVNEKIYVFPKNLTVTSD